MRKQSAQLSNYSVRRCNMLSIAKIDRMDFVNNPKDNVGSVTIWFAGCSFNCPGCHNLKLQSPLAGKQYTPNLIAMSVIDTLRKIDSDRVVFLGGEPTEQDKKDLLKLMHILNKEKVRIWLYTGRDFDDIDPAIRDQCETIKCGRYVAELAQPGFPASSNQKVFRKNVFDDFEDITNHFREEQ